MLFAIELYMTTTSAKWILASYGSIPAGDGMILFLFHDRSLQDLFSCHTSPYEWLLRETYTEVVLSSNSLLHILYTMFTICETVSGIKRIVEMVFREMNIEI